MSLSHIILDLICGGIVGFSLGLTGGGGSLLAVPLIVYVVGVGDPHRAIGTSAVAVSVSAAMGALHHARSGAVRWSCACVFALAGVTGALLGSQLGKAMDGQKLLFLFALLMLAAALLLVRGRRAIGTPAVTLHRGNAPKLAGIGFVTGILSGFFGIGGGFLIVPGLMLATGMPLIAAIGTSLVSVACFGAATAVSYAVSGWIEWPLALVFIAGGAVGGVAGTALASRLSGRRGMLNILFASLMVVVATYMLYRSGSALHLF